MSAKTQKPSKTAPEASVILFGLQHGRPYAASFGPAQASLALKAAKSTGLNVLSVKDASAQSLAAKLPIGRIHAKGAALVAPIKAALYEQIEALSQRNGECRSPALSTATPARANSANPVPTSTDATETAAARDRKYRRPKDWADIDMGTLVIAQEDDKADGWFAGIVIAKQGDMFTLRWRDFPRQRSFMRHRLNLALLYPDGTADQRDSKSAEKTESRYPAHWQEINEGHVVLAQDDGPWSSWWEASVVEADGDHVSLKWRDHQHITAIRRDRLSLALLHPKP